MRRVEERIFGPKKEKLNTRTGLPSEIKHRSMVLKSRIHQVTKSSVDYHCISLEIQYPSH
jgi:hypothetical protein